MIVSKEDILKSLLSMDLEEALIISDTLNSLSRFVLEYCNYIINLAKQNKVKLNSTALKQLENIAKTAVAIKDATETFMHELYRPKLTTIQLG